MVSGARLHVLPDGTRFDLVTRRLVEMPWEVSPEVAEDLRLAEEDLRRMAGDITTERDREDGTG
jgi:cyanophycinase